MYTEIQKKCLDAIMDSDRELAGILIDEWAAENGYENVVVNVLEPILDKLGDMWMTQKDVSFAQVYVSATIAEDIFLKVLEHRPKTEKTEYKGTIVLGNIEDDFHSLGRRLVSIFLMSDGWEIIDLGNDVTAKEFVDAAVSNNVKIIAVSAMMYTTAQNIKKLRTEINDRGYKGKIQLAVGGAVFNLRHDLWEEVGADGTSRNAIDVGTLMGRLMEKSLEEGDKNE